MELNLSSFHFKGTVRMRWSDCDMLGHVNNAVYLTYAEQARTEYCEKLEWDWQKHGLILAKAELLFKKPLLYTDNPFIYVRIAKLGNKSFDMEHIIMDEKGETPELVAVITCVGVMIDYQTSKTFPIPEDVRKKIIDFEQNPEL
ncbi:MAG: acyl-CoA thioesterase [Bacteroidia bacterium]|nr:acyl-CoA thioesterase [Bacteroidia bacterium]